MKFVLNILLIIISFNSICQKNDIRIFDGPSVKIDLRVINEQYACLILDEFDSDNCVLLKYVEKRDTILLMPSDDYIEWGSDVFFYELNSTSEDSVMLETTFRHPFLEGGSSLKECYYVINDKNRYPVLNTSDIYHRTKIKRPDSDVFDLKIYKDGDVLIRQYQIELPMNFNKISIENVDLFSMNFSGFKYWKLFPIEVEFDKDKLILILE